MFIRLANPNEIKIIHSHAKKVQEEATLGYLKNSDPPQNIEMFFSTNSYYFVLINKGILCGWVMVSEMNSPYTNQACGVIVELYVVPSQRKKGYGLELMKFAITHLKNKGFRNVQLNVYQGNPAVNMYKQLGFKQLSTIMEKRL